MKTTISALGKVLDKNTQQTIQGGNGGEIYCPNYCFKYLPYSCRCDWANGI
ncbi:hypothetical protein TPENAI_70080 [Tenacibaculum litopenaei]|uniref:hypothetical protein n=1 Tax=Tenacibaculum litopenaei TaxID=396016 RepID=UPI003893F1A6